MRYGKYIKKGDTIGIVAPSFGCSGYPYEEKAKYAEFKFFNEGYNIQYVPNAFKLNIEDILSDDYKLKAKEFMDMYLDDNISALISIAGGEIMCNTIDHIDFIKIKKAKPKLFVGFSDNTWMNFLLPTLCDIGSVYANNFTSYGQKKWHESLYNTIDILSGKKIIQKSFDKCQLIDISKTPNHATDGFNLDTPSHWKTLDKSKEIEIKGRIIGGCVEVLNSIVGSKYDNVYNFTKKYKKDGIIFFFEACEINVIDQLRSYKHFIDSSWLNNCKGILIGRTKNKDEVFGITYEKMLHECFDSLNIPVIYDVDIGHIDPVLTIVQGSYAKVTYKNKKGTIEQTLI